MHPKNIRKPEVNNRIDLSLQVTFKSTNYVAQP